MNKSKSMLFGKRIILLRYGGIGDTIALTGLGKYLKDELNCVVDYAYASDIVPIDYSKLMDNLGIFNAILPSRRLVDNTFIEIDGIWVSEEELYSKYDYVFNMRNSIESNSMNPDIKRYGFWGSTQNSNWQNWYDIFFQWCNIDPNKVNKKYKRPYYKIEEKEDIWAKEMLKEYGSVIAVHAESSSLPRTWYFDDKLSNDLNSHYGVPVIKWCGDHWEVINDGKKTIISLQEDRLRHSIALLNNVSIVVCTDSSISHFCEAIGKRNIPIYSTIPSWTRNKYYSFSDCIDSDESKLPCYPCFIIGRFCPEREKEARKAPNLTDREIAIFELAQSATMSVGDVAEKFNTRPQAIIEEKLAIERKIVSLSEIQPKCIELVTSKMIIAKIDKSGLIKKD